jgi:hypothetical protein
MSKETDALMSCVLDLLGAVTHIQAAIAACETLKAQRENPKAMDDAIARIDNALSESLFLVLSSPIVMQNIVKSMGGAKLH